MAGRRIVSSKPKLNPLGKLLKGTPKANRAASKVAKTFKSTSAGKRITTLGKGSIARKVSILAAGGGAGLLRGFGSGKSG